MIRFLRTIFDMGLIRFVLRINYEFRKIIDSALPKRFILGKIKPQVIFNSWQNKEEFYFKTKLNLPKQSDLSCKYLEFTFLNKKEKLKLPFNWNNKNWERLWQFNLHYFYWARNSIESYINKGTIDSYLLKLPLLINQWIENNPIGKGDGWHSYTISLRLRNWLWIIQTFPEIRNKKIFISIRKQLLWLYTHLEDSNGGNHYLENLCALIIISLQFEDKKTDQIYSFSLNKLHIELNQQILKDGGHEERTASYHILIMDRLIEVGCVINSKNYETPEWLNKAIKSMLNWTKYIKLKKNNFPRFNDSPVDGCPEIVKVIDFANSFLYGNNKSLKRLNGIRRKLIDNSQINKTKIIEPNINPILNLKDTGWTIIRPGKGWEVVVKSGESGPKHLAGHTHSDLFSFDIYLNGIPIIIESGTSTYKLDKIRNYERSGQAHNVFELIHNNKIIEPVEVWSNFRAGRKAKILTQNSGTNKNGTYWVKSSHDGYAGIKVSYSRELIFNLHRDLILNIEITENLVTKNCMQWRSWIHFSPFIQKKDFNKILSNIKSKNIHKYKVVETPFSNGFGKRKKRNSICFYGMTQKGVNKLKLELNINNIFR